MSVNFFALKIQRTDKRGVYVSKNAYELLPEFVSLQSIHTKKKKMR